MEPAVQKIRELSKGNILDYGLLMSCLGSYASPRNKIGQLIRQGIILRIRKGLYVLGPNYRHGALSMELIANQIYGPSYVSLEWALSFYGLIPEAVHQVSSVTFKRNKNYATSVGHFSYSHCHPKAYTTGLIFHRIGPWQTALMATREKAVCDQLVLRRGKVVSDKELEEILFEDFRFEEDDLQTFDLELLKSIHQAYPHSATARFLKLIKRLSS